MNEKVKFVVLYANGNPRGTAAGDVAVDLSGIHLIHMVSALNAVSNGSGQNAYHATSGLRMKNGMKNEPNTRYASTRARRAIALGRRIIIDASREYMRLVQF